MRAEGRVFIGRRLGPTRSSGREKSKVPRSGDVGRSPGVQVLQDWPPPCKLPAPKSDITQKTNREL